MQFVLVLMDFLAMVIAIVVFKEKKVRFHELNLSSNETNQKNS
jgi:hypothetical protein